MKIPARAVNELLEALGAVLIGDGVSAENILLSMPEQDVADVRDWVERHLAFDQAADV